MSDLTREIDLKRPPRQATPAAAEPAAGSKTRPELTRASELTLVICFLAIIAGVPITQTAIELARHERVQFTDVFRYRPTARNLRRYEAGLKEKSWFQQNLRPQIQGLLFATLRDTGAKGVLGRDQWLFYRPDVGYLLEPNRIEKDESDSKWVQPSAGLTRLQSVERAVVRFRDQLKERGVTLVVVPVPGKPSVYPDQVTRRESGREGDFQSPSLALLQSLESQGVATVNLFGVFAKARQDGADKAPLYLATDTHWTPRGARLAAEAMADRLRELALAPTPMREFRLQAVPVARWGDVLEMMQIPGLKKVYSAQEVMCEQVLDPTLGPLTPTASDRPGTYRFPGQKAAVLVLGDSFCRIYQYPEPQSLGELAAGAAGAAQDGRRESGTKRLLPGSAGLVSHLAAALGAPVDAIYSDGGAATDVRRKLSTNPEILEGKRVVIWEFAERDVALGAAGWEDVPLPGTID